MNATAPTRPQRPRRRVDDEEDPEDTRLAFARAIASAGSDAMYINAENERAGFDPIERAHASGRAYSVVKHPALFVADEDAVKIKLEGEVRLIGPSDPASALANWMVSMTRLTPSHSVRVIEGLAAAFGSSDTRTVAPTQEDKLLALAKLMESRGDAPVLVNSGNGRHLLCFVGDEGRRSEYATLARASNLGLLASLRIRPPLSPHRAGKPTGLIYPATAQQALERLQPPPMPQDRPNARQRHDAGAVTAFDEPPRRTSPRLPLPPHIEDLMQNASDRSAAIMSAALSAYQRGWTQEEFAVTVMDSHAGSKLRGRRHADREIARAWAKAEKYVAAHPPDHPPAAPGVLDEITAIRAAMAAHLWPGRTGATDRVVLDQLLLVAESANCLTIAPGVRRLAELTALKAHTVSKALRRLSPTWITIAPYSRKRRPSDTARQYQPAATLTIRACAANGTSMTHPSGCEQNCALNRLAGHDAFRRGALGSAGGLVLYALDVQDLRTAAEIAVILGWMAKGKPNARRVRPHLVRLEKHGLAVRDEQGQGWRRGGGDLAAVARTRGTHGDGARQRELHDRERSQYTKNIEEGRTRRREAEQWRDRLGGAEASREEYAPLGDEDVERMAAPPTHD